MDKKKKETRSKSKESGSKPKTKTKDDSPQPKKRATSKDKKETEKNDKKAVTQKASTSKERESRSTKEKPKSVKPAEKPIRSSTQSKERKPEKSKTSTTSKSTSKQPEKSKDSKIRSDKTSGEKDRRKEKDKRKETDKDKQKEKPKDGEKEKRKDKEKDKSKEKSSKKSKSKEITKEPVENGVKEVVEDEVFEEIIEETEYIENGVKEVEEDYDYEDDFEDYEEDFEEDEESEEEDEPEASTSKYKDDSPEPSAESDSDHDSEAKDTVPEPQPKIEEKPKQIQRRPSTSRIDFSTATSTEINLGALGKVMKRHVELQKLIEMDSVAYNIVELAPIRDYEFYIQTFGKGNRTQVQVQTGDDSVEREIQSEEVDDESKWTQHPPTDFYGCGSDKRTKTYEQEHEVRFDTEIYNSTRFKRFIGSSGQLICDLLSEELTSEEFSCEQKSDGKFSDGYSEFSLGKLAQKSHVTAVSFCPSQPNLLLTAFYVNESLADELMTKGVLAIWSVNFKDRPLHLLLCENLPTCCCFNPDRVAAIFAGLDDGSVVAWDLNESDSLHWTIPWKNHEIPLKTPTYNTSYLNGATSNHNINLQSPIRALATIGGGSQSESDQSASSYQLASLEETGLVHIWTVLEILSATDTSESDLGLSPGGKLKLVKTATIQPTGLTLKRLTSNSSIQSFCMAQQEPGKASFYMGTDTGYIVHLARQETGETPRSFQSDLEAPADVLSLDFSSFDSEVLLSGSSDGRIRIYKINFQFPLINYQISGDSSPVTCVKWSPISSVNFYSIHGKKKLVIWNLEDNKPIFEQEFTEKIASLSVNTATHSKDQAQMAIALENGETQVHQLKPLEGSSKFGSTAGDLRDFLYSL